MKDIKFVSVAPKTFQVVELKDQQQQVKKSNLSVAARNKIINRSGGNYLSERINDLVPTYGPCTDYNCTHTFWLNLKIGYTGFWGANGYYFREGDVRNISYTVHSIGQAKDLLRKFHTGSIWVCNEVGAASNNTRRKNEQAIQALESWIRVFENGQNVSEPVDLGR